MQVRGPRPVAQQRHPVRVPGRGRPGHTRSRLRLRHLGICPPCNTSQLGPMDERLAYADMSPVLESARTGFMLVQAGQHSLAMQQRPQTQLSCRKTVDNRQGTSARYTVATASAMLAAMS